jgi:hypothetical protein
MLRRFFLSFHHTPTPHEKKRILVKRNEFGEKKCYPPRNLTRTSSAFDDAILQLNFGALEENFSLPDSPLASPFFGKLSSRIFHVRADAVTNNPGLRSPARRYNRKGLLVLPRLANS